MCIRNSTANTRPGISTTRTRSDQRFVLSMSTFNAIPGSSCRHCAPSQNANSAKKHRNTSKDNQASVFSTICSFAMPARQVDQTITYEATRHAANAPARCERPHDDRSLCFRLLFLDFSYAASPCCCIAPSKHPVRKSEDVKNEWCGRKAPEDKHEYRWAYRRYEQHCRYMIVIG